VAHVAASRRARTGRSHRACGQHGGVAGGGGSVAQWPMDEDVAGLSKRGSRDGCRTRGGGSEAYPVAVRHEGVEAVRRGGTLRRRQTLVEGGGWRQVLEIVEDERRMSRGEIDLEDDRRWRSPRDRIHDDV
jgi:hypothetical protein